ncbi:hypothetical protein QEZ52_07115 [Aliisedimentitalea scapharcae]|uniref:Uncharacterized protein n=1 Tax=Aliisedimentitalea scapharcae TaxID=1524259 RepID=A0ABZ2XW09_9RHOB
MIRLAAVFGLMACSALAEQAPGWEGHWSGNANWCVRAGEVGDETPTWFGRDGFFGIEWSCDITRARPTGLPNSWTIDTTCLDAGFEYKQSQLFLLTVQDRLLIIDETGVTDNLVRCVKGQ